MNSSDMLALASHWSARAFLLVFGALLLDLFQRRALNRLLRKVQTRTKNLWDDTVVASLRTPLSLLIWVLGISFAAESAQVDPGNSLFALVPALRGLGAIAAFSWFMILLVKNGELAYLETERRGEAAVDRATVNAFAKLLRMSIFITAGLVALQNIGFSISGVLAFGGIGGLAVGLAAKDLLANFFGTLMLFLDRPFVVGDWIRSPDKEIEGTVEHISWRMTRIRTFDKRPLYVPNATFSTIAVENPSRMTHRRIYETLGIRYEDAPKMEAITDAVKEMLANHPEIDSGQTLMVNFTTFASSSLDFFIYAFTRTKDWAQFHEVKQDVLLKVSAIVADHGAKIAFPTSTLHLPAGSNAAAPFSANRNSE